MFFAAKNAAKLLDPGARSRAATNQESLLGALQARKRIIMTLRRNPP